MEKYWFGQKRRKALATISRDRSFTMNTRRLRRSEYTPSLGHEGKLAEGWSLGRIDRTLHQILRAGTYELLARPDVPVGSVINEYLDVAHAFYEPRETAFANALLDAVARLTRG